MRKRKIDFSALNWVNVGKGARYKVYKDAETQLRLIEFSEGLEHPDWCLKGHSAYVLEGRLELQFESATEIYEAGSVIYIADGELDKHRPKPLTPVVRLFSVEKP